MIRIPVAMGKDQNANWCVTHPWFDHDATGKVIGEEPEPVAKNLFDRLVRPIFESVLVSGS